MGVVDSTVAFMEEVHRPRKNRYIDLPFPSKLDDLALLLVEAYRNATESERIASRSLLDSDVSNCLWTFAKRSASQAVRCNSEASLFDGLSALVIENLREDDRESRMLMSVIINAAVRLGIDPVVLLRRATAFAAPRMDEWLISIINMYINTKNSSLMGYKEGFDQNDLVYY